MCPSEYYDKDYYFGGKHSAYANYYGQMETFDKIWIPLIGRYLSGLRISPPGKVLDIGCGFGFLVDKMNKMGWEAYGVDVSKFAIEQGLKLGIKNIQVSSAKELPFPDNWFRLIMCLDVIEHLSEEDYKKTIREMYRVLEPGSPAIIATPNAIDCSGYNIFSQDFIEDDPSHINYRSRNELRVDFSVFTRVFIHGETPYRGQFRSFRGYRWLPRSLNSVVRRLLYPILRRDIQHSAYLIVIAIK